MPAFDDIDAKKALRARGNGDRLAQLAREWFAEARTKTAREDTEFAGWKRGRLGSADAGGEGLFDLFGDSDGGDCGGE